MDRINVLDCTLRDGGYCNQWRFREKNIRRIIDGLITTKVEIVECGFLTNNIKYNKDVTKYTDLGQLKSFIPKHGEGTKFVVMLNYGEYAAESLPECENAPIDGVRIAFHKVQQNEAIKLSQRIKQKGYDVYLQPMVTMLYTDEEFSNLIQLANGLEPYAFYLVDSFGTMTEDDMLHYYKIAETILKEDICLGFHSHNNLQSAFSNARALTKQDTNRKIIIDSSIYGMGRGAGNLNSELFLNELNSKQGKKYEMKPLLKIMDEVISQFYNEQHWGYSLPNYLSAVHMIHPNYARFLTEKSSLMIDDIDEIFSMMEADKAVEYNEEYISKLYFQYMSMGVIRNEHLYEIKEKIKGRNLLFIAPGKSILENRITIQKFVEENSPVVISINHESNVVDTDYIFISNIRRFSQLSKDVYNKTISTSNIKSKETYASIDYYKLLNAIDVVSDNAALMAIKFAIEELKPSGIYLAGLDGYSNDAHVNYESEELVVYMPNDLISKMNEGMKMMLGEYKKNFSINFITPSLLM